MSKIENDYLSKAWGNTGVVAYFQNDRQTTADVYPSEWFFIKDLLREGMTVLDIGCAHGGFSKILAEHLKNFSYVGVDVSSEMLAVAREKGPQHEFIHVPEGDLSALGSKKFDLVLCLGILHLSVKWRELVGAAWAHTQGALVLDLRESSLETIENIEKSYFKMDFSGKGEAQAKDLRLPYNIINTADALRVVETQCPKAAQIVQYGYKHPVRGSAVTPIPEVVMKTYCIKRAELNR